MRPALTNKPKVIPKMYRLKNNRNRGKPKFKIELSSIQEDPSEVPEGAVAIDFRLFERWSEDATAHKICVKSDYINKERYAYKEGNKFGFYGGIKDHVNLRPFKNKENFIPSAAVTEEPLKKFNHQLFGFSE